MKLHATVFRETREPVAGTGSPRSSLLAKPLAEEACGPRFAASVVLEDGGRERTVDLSDATVAGLSGKLAGLIGGAKNGAQPEFGVRFVLEGALEGTMTVAGAEAMVEVRYRRSELAADEVTAVFRELDTAIANESGKKQG